MGFSYDDNFKQVDTLRPFKYWCNKVLPAVYDDSLSYYELLNKVVHYLNETMENVNELNENFQKLKMVFDQLVEFANAFEQIVNNRLDAQDAKIEQLEDDVDTFIQKQDAKIAQLEDDVDAFIQMMEQKFNNFTAEMKIYVDRIAKETAKQEVTTYVNSDDFSRTLDEKIANLIGENVGDNVEQILSDTTEIKNNLDSCCSNLNEKNDALLSDTTEIKNNLDSCCSNLNEKNDTLLSTIGSKGDSQASATDGSVMGKLNLLIKAGAGSGSTDVNVQSIVDNIGNTDDTNGSQTAGTIFGKLNKIQEEVSGTSTGEQQIVTELSNLDSKMGSTTDTGGTQTTGTLFGKLNSCLQNLPNLLNFVQTNNTANKTGTLSQKLSYLINNSGSVNVNSPHYMKVLAQLEMTNPATDLSAEFDINGGLYMALSTNALPENWEQNVAITVTLNDIAICTQALTISSSDFIPLEVTPFQSSSSYLVQAGDNGAAGYSYYFAKTTAGARLYDVGAAKLCGHMKITIYNLPDSTGKFFTFIQI